MPTSKKTQSGARKTDATVAVKRKRNSKPLFAEVELGKLNGLLGSDLSKKVMVSRNFIMDLQRADLEKKAEAELGI